ncbi:MAG: hypothetical protein ACO3RX_00075 [Chthoniobacterales bacterium]
MGANDSRFYYYPGTQPDGSTPLQPIDLGRLAGLVDETPEPVEFSVGSLAGRETVQTWAVDLPVRITVDGIPAGVLQRQLQALTSHLRRGGVVGFALVHAKFFAACRQGGLLVSAGSDLSGVPLGESNWYQWNTSTSLGSGDLVAVEGFDGVRMVHAVSSVGLWSAYSAQITLDGNLEFPVGDFVVRERYTYPALRLAPDGRRAPLLSTANGHTWSLDLPLVVDRYTLRETLSELPGTSGAPATTGGPWRPRA